VRIEREQMVPCRGFEVNETPPTQISERHVDNMIINIVKYCDVEQLIRGARHGHSAPPGIHSFGDI
jgi:hypothetical protein